MSVARVGERNEDGGCVGCGWEVTEPGGVWVGAYCDCDLNEMHLEECLDREWMNMPSFEYCICRWLDFGGVTILEEGDEGWMSPEEVAEILNGEEYQ